MKYIVCEVRRNGEPYIHIPVVFPDIMVHAMVFAQMRALLEMQFFSSKEKTEVVALSAGSLSSMNISSPDEDEVMCYGKSDSLGVKSRGADDDKLIMMSDYGSGAMC